MQGSQDATPVVKPIGLREYARSRHERHLPGGSLRAVQKAIDDGRISAWVWHETKSGKKQRKISDPVLADRQWQESASLSQEVRQAAASSVAGPTPTAPASPAAPESAVAPETPVDPERAEFLSLRKNYLDHQSRLKAAQAELKELEAAQRRGELVARARVERDHEVGARLIRDQSLSFATDLGRRMALTFSLDETRAVYTCKTAMTEFLVSLSAELGQAAMNEQAA